MPSLDWTSCPNCGEVDAFEIQTDERVYGTSCIDVTIGPDRRLQTADSHDTDISWNTVKVIGYYSACCITSLPDEYQEALDRALNIARDT